MPTLTCSYIPFQLWCLSLTMTTATATTTTTSRGRAPHSQTPSKAHRRAHTSTHTHRNTCKCLSSIYFVHFLAVLARKGKQVTRGLWREEGSAKRFTKCLLKNSTTNNSSNNNTNNNSNGKQTNEGTSWNRWFLIPDFNVGPVARFA